MTLSVIPKDCSALPFILISSTFIYKDDCVSNVDFCSTRVCASELILTISGSHYFIPPHTVICIHTCTFQIHACISYIAIFCD